MAQTKPGHVSLNGLELVIQDATYTKQLQTPFNPRFSTGEPNLGDLSFFQFLSMEDFSGGSGQEIFTVNNRFSDSENIDVTAPGELKLAPLIEPVISVNGPQQEHLNRPVEDEDAWPQIIEWLGKAVVFNDKIEFDAGGVEFLEVFETEIVQDEVINKDLTGTAGVITDDTRAEILDISRPFGLPGDTILVKARFTNPEFDVISVNDVFQGGQLFRLLGKADDPPYKVAFRLYFTKDVFPPNRPTTGFAEQILSFGLPLFTVLLDDVVTRQVRLNQTIDIDFTIRIPEVNPGIYNLTTEVGVAGRPFTLFAGADPTHDRFNARFPDDGGDARVLFFVQSVDQVLVTRKNLYAPQLKAAAVLGSKLVGGRVIEGEGFIEVYEDQNAAVDRTLQVGFTSAGITPTAPTYMEFVASNNLVIAALDNRIFAVDLLTVGLTDAQRFTFIGQAPGDYVSGMALWNQRIYIASFDKSNFTSVISWTNGSELQGSYSIDGKFWITDMANFNGALFYSGGTQDGVGQVRLYPAEEIIDVEHSNFDARIRTLNAGRNLYFGHSHGTGIGTITKQGASKWAVKDLGDEITNVVWDIEEVGADVFFFSGNSLFKTTRRFASSGFWESSQIGGNTPLIDKIWDSVTIETETLSGAHKIRVLCRNAANPDSQWFILGDITSADGVQKEFFFPPDYQAQWVEIRLEFSTTDNTTTPIVNRILTKYVPSALVKLQWAFSIRATDGLKFLDGNTQRISGANLASAIWSMTEFGVVPFRDVDETAHNVIITDVKQTRPVLNKRNDESIITVELLEA